MNKNITATTLIIALELAFMWVISSIFQTYRFTSLEESYIFLYDAEYNAHIFMQPGGCAMLAASWLSQFFIFPSAGPLIAVTLYGLITTLLYFTSRKPRPLWEAALASLPCLLIMLCIENINYKFQGHMALLISVIAIWIFNKINRWRTASGILLFAATYWVAGSAAIFSSISMIIMCAADKKAIPTIAIAAVTIILPYLVYTAGMINSLSDAYSPAMYYDHNSTYYFMLYALISLPAFTIASATSTKSGKCNRSWLCASLLLIAEMALSLWMLSKVHNQANYENHTMRYYARTEQWDKITSMPYHGRPTPYTSYRFLALAKEGRLVQELKKYSPFIKYYLDNKPVTKKEDRQIYSDIYYHCDYVAAARHAAFDTDIITTGPFNPYETRKLAEIYIATGNCKLAEKAVSHLEKTLFHAQTAAQLRKYIGNDEAIKSHPKLSALRRAIPVHDNYLSPKGTLRDLEAITDVNPGQECARQMLEAFKILIYQL